MKQIPLIIIMMIALFSHCAFAEETAQSSELGHVTVVNILGQLWQNANRGGFFFYTDTLPTGIAYFIVRGESELYVNRLLATLLAAKTMNKKIVVNYIKHGEEGDVVAIGIE